MNWVSKIFKSKNRVVPVSKINPEKPFVLLLASDEFKLNSITEFGNKINEFNVFILSKFDNWETQIEQLIQKWKLGNLPVISFGKASILGLNIVNVVEKQGVNSKLILVDGTLKVKTEFSTDKTIIDEKDKSANGNILKSLNIVLIKSPIFVFFAIGGVNIIEEDYQKCTSNNIYNFPINGHYFEILKETYINDVAFFVSNILKGRHNLLSFTLTTQSATPNWYIDVEGRPMGEGKAPELCKKDIPFEMKKCPYPGTRKNHKKPMNVSALKQMRASWNESLNVIRLIRDLYLEQNPKNKLELVDVWKITIYASYLPTFMLYKKENRFLNHCVPSVIASVYKMFIGLKTPVERMIQEEFVGESKFDNITSKIIHDYAEENGSFVGPDEVCGGPENLVVEFLEAFMDLSIPSKENKLFNSILPNKNNFHHFVHSIINVQILQNIHFQQTQYLVKEYLNLSENEKVKNKLKEAFYVDDNSIPKEKHISIVNELKLRIEEAGNYQFLSFDNIQLNSIEDVEELDNEINTTFYKNLKCNENSLLAACKYNNKVIVNESIYNQYMGLMPFSSYYNTKI